MTVKELIEKLQKIDENAEVVLVHDTGLDEYPIAVFTDTEKIMICSEYQSGIFKYYGYIEP